MSKVREWLSGTVLALLALGYLASQASYFFGDPAEYAGRIDRPEVKYLSLVVLIAAIALAFFPERGKPE
jgi:hypothetical protein